MTIDWFTVGSQTINFMLLVWLLKRYLYGPILKAIDARESQVAKVLSDAELIKSDAELQRNLFQQKNTEIDTKREELLNKAKINAADQSEQIVFQAHNNADEISKSRLEALEKELEHYQDDLTLKTLQEIYEVARKVLTDLADVALEQKMLECFCKHLLNLSPDEKSNLNKTVEAVNSVLLLYSTFELTPAQMEEIDVILQKIIAQTTTDQITTSTNLSRGYQLKQVVKTSLISGIELRSNGWKIAWNSEDYLKVMKTKVNQLLTEQRETLNTRIVQLNSQQHSHKASV
ncbi:MAG: F-type H+-transporting ATPase subunit b [Congregibacter sp.]|jgi:F-type H+-transporting ATPase subunit b